MRYIRIVVVEGDLLWRWKISQVVGGFQQPDEGGGGFGYVISDLRERERDQEMATPVVVSWVLAKK
ncbi:hypothetical protein Hanom_Chr01g00053371 [Helianthus anomalus]